ncbi:hypothetical protein NIA71_04565 [Ihubacter massiliensis]|uniref:Uncharacterized protein n=1 Tax=Hominibacterium faecale TaxID=2839743 RepID=A0A9J6QM08_9FIRM|nr:MULTISPECIES: DUF6652 family protein [Eubacteriales Family XIII. Incertae Sedis]MCO7121223.1 hypothetical protein [Ihubacter massiliensis]MCU7378209.1 hypothetical protein [Hominibacterium faecale]
MKRVRMLLIAVYIYFSLLIAELASITVLIISNIARACKQYAAEDYTGLRRGMRRLKLSLIPFFVLNFLLCMAVALVIFAASRGFAIFIPWVWIWVVCAIGITYLIAAGTSAYGILFVRALRKKGLVSKKQMVLYMVFQFCFVADIIDMIVLLKKYKEGTHA